MFPPGTYYLKVEGFTDPLGGGFSPLDLMTCTQSSHNRVQGVKVPGGVVDCGTTNDTRECADDFDLNSTVSYSIDPIDDIDWLRIEVTQAGTLRIWTTGNTDVIAGLTDNNGNFLVIDDDSGTGWNFEIVHDVTPGTYYLVVEGFETGPYDLHSEFPAGAGRTVDCSTTNDTLDCADDFPLNDTLSYSIDPAG